jgi:ferredoxin-type protein NapG
MVDESEPMPEKMSRQRFIQDGVEQLLSRFSNLNPFADLPDTMQVPRIRPPGTQDAKHFLSHCEPFCGECRNACPRNAILQDPLGLPYIDPTLSPCVMCNDVPCTRVCPTEALHPLNHPQEIDLGTAMIELTVCTAYQGSGCTTCYDTCPIPDQAIRLVEGLPEVIPEACTGCGVCVYECPTPGAIMILRYS